MDLYLYDTRSREKRKFQPMQAGKVQMYHCGPTVYQRPHIGNYRAFLFADILRRFFEWNGYEVKQIMNLTDVGHLQSDADEGEDKLEVQAKKEALNPWDIVERVTGQFFNDLDALRIQRAHAYPKATDFIQEMVVMIEELIKKGNAYQVGENVYFDVHSFPKYGELSGNHIEDLEAGARLEINQEKRHPADFALWKSDSKHLMKWKTKFGEHGFPGWHIECSAMSHHYLGESFDIHTGGEDNVFPHHECEIAQSESLFESNFVNFWMHTKFLQVDNGKMSKSLGNAYVLDDLLDKGFSSLDFKFFILRSHYRTLLNFTFEGLQGAAEGRKKIVDFIYRLRSTAGDAPREDSDHVTIAFNHFSESLCDDLNTSSALAAVFQLRKSFLQNNFSAGQAQSALRFISEHVEKVFGCFPEVALEHTVSDADIEKLIKKRDEARASRDWEKADIVRTELESLGVVLEDTPDGVTWYRS